MVHEDLAREDHVEGSSDRVFGLVFAVVFVVIACWPALHREQPRWWAFVIAAGFALIALLKPVFLAWPNRLWIKLGVMLSKVVSPIALGVLYYCVFVPVGAARRLTDKDPLRLRRDPDAKSYWLRREPPGPPPSSMTNQF